MHLKDRESVQNHIKVMMVIFKASAMIDDPVSEEEDHVVHLLPAYLNSSTC